MVADSTTNVEYIVACGASKETIWTKNFIQELDLVLSIVDPMLIIVIIPTQLRMLTVNGSSKVRAYFGTAFIKEIIGKGDVKVERVSSTENVADPLTKPLSKKYLKVILRR
ncbi:UNVERIFIED_CONTAM: hypothetical protein Scaly_0058800 [Sesamum calycinum]|uniref:Uncharacterized protein n=1 Tax=Sesamum calycinum TaxID=2727403 RepID=A0AAW2SUX2_9LAMI